jgi:phage terminase large subunit
MRTSRVFSELLHAYTLGFDIIESRGGTRSTKTYSALQLLSLLAEYDKTPTVTSVVSETLPHLKKGAIRDYKAIMSEDGRWDEARWNATDRIYTFPSGSIIEFFGADAPAKVHGPARDRLFVNECQNLRWETVNQLFIRTKGLKMLDYNPTHEFWIQDEVSGRPGTSLVTSTYLDNPFLTAEQVRAIEANRHNANWWRVYGLGKFGQLRGRIYNFEQIDRMPDEDGLIELYGLDFGFTNDPTALVRILADTGRKSLYLDELAYDTGMQDEDIIRTLRLNGVRPHGPEIYADCAEPKAIRKIQNAGYNVRPSYKGKELASQISEVQGWKIYVTKGSVNLIKEQRNYTWAEDANGKLLNVPIDMFNHALDAVRYGVFTKFVHLAQVHRGDRPTTAPGWRTNRR